MNWQEVRTRFPKSFDRLCNLWGDLELNGKGILIAPYSVDMHFNERELYDFFDEQGIIIEIGVNWTMEPKYCCRVIRDYWGDDRQRKWSDLFYKRTEAEEQAFLRAFEILEDRLKEGR